MPSPSSDTLHVPHSPAKTLVEHPVQAHRLLLRGPTEQVSLDWAPVVLGRDERCSLSLASATTSRFHCVLYRLGEQAVVRDLHSTNGILLNGQPVLYQATLAANDRLEVGGCVFRLEQGAVCSHIPRNEGVVMQIQLDTPGDISPERQQAFAKPVQQLLDRLENRVLWHFGQVLTRQAQGFSCVFGLWPHHDPHYQATAEALDTALAAIEESQLRDFPELSLQLGLAAGPLTSTTLSLAADLAHSNALYKTSLLMNGSFFELLDQQKGAREVDRVRFAAQAPAVSLYTWDERLVRSRQFLFNGWYQMGLSAYRQGLWPEAEGFFQQGADAGDPLSKLMLQRLQILKIQTPASWDGIWILEGS